MDTGFTWLRPNFRDDDDEKFEKKLKNLEIKSEDEEDGFSDDEVPVKKPAKSGFQHLVMLLAFTVLSKRIKHLFSLIALIN